MNEALTNDPFRLLVQSIVDYAIYLLDPEGNVTSWNAGAERIKGFQTDEIVGRHFSQFYTKKTATPACRSRCLRLHSGRASSRRRMARTQGRLTLLGKRRRRPHQ